MVNRIVIEMENVSIDMYQEFLGKDVLVVYLNGYKKFGHVLAIDSQFLKLRYYTGNVEMINSAFLLSLNSKLNSKNLSLLRTQVLFSCSRPSLRR